MSEKIRRYTARLFEIRAFNRKIELKRPIDAVITYGAGIYYADFNELNIHTASPDKDDAIQEFYEKIVSLKETYLDRPVYKLNKEGLIQRMKLQKYIKKGT